MMGVPHKRFEALPALTVSFRLIGDPTLVISRPLDDIIDNRDTPKACSQLCRNGQYSILSFGTGSTTRPLAGAPGRPEGAERRQR